MKGLKKIIDSIWRFLIFLKRQLTFFWVAAIDWFSFDDKIETLVEALNHKLDEPPTKLAIRIPSHPGGFIRELDKRRISIAGAYIKIAHDLSPEDTEGRLSALTILVDRSLHAKTLNMPLNTARVQINLMKEAVKARGNKRRQMEAMTDFGLASFGQEAVIREFLDKMHMVEVPEEEKPLKELEMGWDDHVHDNLTEGRKTPTQVLLDAFVKGLSEVTLVHSNIEQRGMIHETITAANILGINIRIGIEFSVGKSGGRRHYLYIPPHANASNEFFSFFDQRSEVFSFFHDGLKANIANRHKTLLSIIDRFNSTQRPKINSGFNSSSPCWFPPLTIEDLNRVVLCGQATQTHLFELLFHKARGVFHKRVVFLKAQALMAQQRFEQGSFSEWERKNIVSHYKAVREEYETMTPESLGAKFLENKDVVDYDSYFTDELSVLPNLLSAGGDIVLVHPLEMGLKEAMLHLIHFSSLITRVETYNLHDSVHRNPNDLDVFNKFLDLLNNNSVNELLEFFEQAGVSDISESMVQKAKEAITNRLLIPVCGSDATGRDPSIPGMGFIRSARIPPKNLVFFREQHYKLPRPISELIVNKGKSASEKIFNQNKDILCMGKSGKLYQNEVGDESQVQIVGLRNFWNYLNPTLKNFIRISIGFAPAYFFIGFNNAMIWFGITSIRNILVDLISASGLNVKSWYRKSINFDNVSQSLFWTGFSVPILNTVKESFNHGWPMAKVGLLYELTKFFFICFANGLYISTHNWLRNFNRKVRRGNFFRSVLSWPFATVFSPIGNFLGVESIVQAKFWSDVVGGLIEGSSKYQQQFVLRKRDLNELFPKLYSTDRSERLTAKLDILYIWAYQPRGKTCIKQLLLQKRSIWEGRKDGAQTPEELKQKRVLYERYYNRLISLYGDPGYLSAISEFVLKNFYEKEAVLLIDLIGNQSQPFIRWLRDLKPLDRLNSPGN